MNWHNHLSKELATLGSLGYTKAPGTVGSLVALGGVYVMNAWTESLSIQVFLIIIMSGIALASIKRAVTYFSDDDPQQIIIDEVVGCFVAFYGLPLKGSIVFVCFILFRLFDITKIAGIAYVEKMGEQSWAILADDLVAGLLANVVMRLVFLGILL
jgi:phosphatidylglycerophosphatase A